MWLFSALSLRLRMDRHSPSVTCIAFLPNSLTGWEVPLQAPTFSRRALFVLYMCGWLTNVFCKEGIIGIDKRLKRLFSMISVEALNLTLTIRQLSAIEQTNSLPYCKNNISPVRLCVFNHTSRLMWVPILLRGHKTPFPN